MRGEEMGGGIFALRRPRPYSRHCEEIVAGYAAPTIVYAHIGINGSGEWADSDAACRVGYKNRGFLWWRGMRMEAAAMATCGSQCDTQWYPRKRRL